DVDEDLRAVEPKSLRYRFDDACVRLVRHEEVDVVEAESRLRERFPRGFGHRRDCELEHRWPVHPDVVRPSVATIARGRVERAAAVKAKVPHLSAIAVERGALDPSAAARRLDDEGARTV